MHTSNTTPLPSTTGALLLLKQSSVFLRQEIRSNNSNLNWKHLCLGDHWPWL